MLEDSKANVIINKIRTGNLEAVNELYQLSGNSINEIPTLLANIADPDPIVREAASTALANYRCSEYEPKWEAEKLVFDAISTAECNSHRSLILALGTIGSEKACKSLIKIITNNDSETSDIEIALIALKQCGAIAYPFVDEISNFMRSSDDPVNKLLAAEALKVICREVRELYTLASCNDKSTMNAGTIVIKGTITPSSLDPELTLLYDDRISYSSNGFNSSCRLVLFKRQDQVFCVFSMDEFSYGTSVTNSAELLIRGAKNKFNLDNHSTLFLEQYDRGHYCTELDSELSIVWAPDDDSGQVKGWTEGVMCTQVAELLGPYLKRPIPIPKEFMIQELLAYYLPPNCRESGIL